MYGWIGKILRVNLSDAKFEIEKIDMKLCWNYIGGRGLAAKILFDEIDPTVDPLSSENKLVLATGPLTGTKALGGTRYMAVTKSPLTGAIAGSNSAGFFPSELKFAGFDMIIFEGRAEKPVYLWIEDDKIEIRPASRLWGKSTSETRKLIRDQTNSRAKIACIGPAGENLVKYACIINDTGRAAGRSGVGAVMGSKNLKAVAVRGTGVVEIANEKGLKDIIRLSLKKIKRPAALTIWGTPYLVNITNTAGVLPTKNYQYGQFDTAEKISGETLKDTLLKKNTACYRCSMACGRYTRVDSGPYQSEGEGPEYETIAAFGPCCMIDDLAVITKANHLCNEYGMDTMSTGTTIACAMELIEKNLLQKAGTNLQFGHAESLINAIHLTANREGIGDLLAEGSYRLAESCGNPELSMSVKKQELAGYDPRGCVGLGLGYATSNRGGDHCRGMLENAEIIGLPEPIDRFAANGKASLLIEMQDETAAIDSMGLCLFLSSYRIGQDNVFKQLAYATGVDFDTQSILKAGERIWNIERLFNLKAGFLKKDDTLPDRMLKEPMPAGPAKGYTVPLETMLQEYYQLRGWDDQGNPTPEKIKELDIPIK